MGGSGEDNTADAGAGGWSGQQSVDSMDLGSKSWRLKPLSIVSIDSMEIFDQDKSDSSDESDASDGDAANQGQPEAIPSSQDVGLVVEADVVEDNAAVSSMTGAGFYPGKPGVDEWVSSALQELQRIEFIGNFDLDGRVSLSRNRIFPSVSQPSSYRRFSPGFEVYYQELAKACRGEPIFFDDTTPIGSEARQVPGPSQAQELRGALEVAEAAGASQEAELSGPLVVPDFPGAPQHVGSPRTVDKQGEATGGAPAVGGDPPHRDSWRPEGGPESRGVTRGADAREVEPAATRGCALLLEGLSLPILSTTQLPGRSSMYAGGVTSPASSGIGDPRRKAPGREGGFYEHVDMGVPGGASKSGNGAIIGRGGMGVVRIGTQYPMKREVAVKMVDKDTADRDATNSLLVEAMAGAILEHPNIPPVYLIGADDQKRAMLVMRKVGGTTWSRLLRAYPAFRNLAQAAAVSHVQATAKAAAGSKPNAVAPGGNAVVITPTGEAPPPEASPQPQPQHVAPQLQVGQPRKPARGRKPVVTTSSRSQGIKEMGNGAPRVKAGGPPARPRPRSKAAVLPISFKGSIVEAELRKDALRFHINVLIKVADAIQHAHSRSILHRDIKPSNVMIEPTGNVYLLDWGLAAALPSWLDAPAVLPRVGTSTSSSSGEDFCGTPAYMAPEMIHNLLVGLHADAEARRQAEQEGAGSASEGAASGTPTADSGGGGTGDPVPAKLPPGTADIPGQGSSPEKEMQESGQVDSQGAPGLPGGSGDDGVLSELTDIYLLGGCLHEMATGSPPHSGENIYNVLFNHIQPSQERAYDATVPPTLQAIIRKAMHRKPSLRYHSAMEVRTALSLFLDQHHSEELGANAEVTLAELEARVNAVLAAPPEPSGAVLTRSNLYRLLGECRFGFHAALHVFPDNQATKNALRQALRKMAEYEIHCRDPVAARALLKEMTISPLCGSVPPFLAMKVAELEISRMSDQLALRRLREAEAASAEKPVDKKASELLPMTAPQAAAEAKPPVAEIGALADTPAPVSNPTLLAEFTPLSDPAPTASPAPVLAPSGAQPAPAEEQVDAPAGKVGVPVDEACGMAGVDASGEEEDENKEAASVETWDDAREAADGGTPLPSPLPVASAGLVPLAVPAVSRRSTVVTPAEHEDALASQQPESDAAQDGKEAAHKCMPVAHQGRDPRHAYLPYLMALPWLAMAFLVPLGACMTGVSPGVAAGSSALALLTDAIAAAIYGFQLMVLPALCERWPPSGAWLLDWQLVLGFLIMSLVLGVFHAATYLAGLPLRLAMPLGMLQPAVGVGLLAVTLLSEQGREASEMPTRAGVLCLALLALISRWAPWWIVYLLGEAGHAALSASLAHMWVAFASMSAATAMPCHAIHSLTSSCQKCSLGKGVPLTAEGTTATDSNDTGRKPKTQPSEDGACPEMTTSMARYYGHKKADLLAAPGISCLY
eukprot:jgi/Mesvir1/14194/Mv09650-RA.1